MKWVKIVGFSADNNEVFARIDDDGGLRITCSALHPEFVAWCERGNTPEEWEPVVPGDEVTGE